MASQLGYVGGKDRRGWGQWKDSASMDCKSWWRQRIVGDGSLEVTSKLETQEVVDKQCDSPNCGYGGVAVAGSTRPVASYLTLVFTGLGSFPSGHTSFS